MRSKLLALSAAGVFLVIGCSDGGGDGGGGPTDYDVDGDGLIEVANLEQLDAMRWDLDGDGSSDGGGEDGFGAAYPGAAEGMGCPESGCIGYELARDLDFNDAGSYASGAVAPNWINPPGWLPVGDHSTPFAADFDGGGYTVSNLLIDRPDQNYVGLFGETAGAVRNTGLVDSDVSGGTTVGALVGRNSGEIDSAAVTGEITGARDTGGLAGANWGVIAGAGVDAEVSGTIVVGALAGLNYGEISDSSAKGSVAGRSRVVGGLAAINWDTITDSYSEAAVSGSDVVGGLVGLQYGAVMRSYSTGDLLSEYLDAGGLVGTNYGEISYSYSTSEVAANNRAGGLVGSNRISGTISGSYSTGALSGVFGIGGLVGWNDGIISESYAAGSVTGSEDNMGGLVGRNSGEISASYARGDVTGDHIVGGLVGYNAGAGSISASYSVGSVVSRSTAGGLLGWNRGRVSDAYTISKVSITGGSEAEIESGGFSGENTGSIWAGYWNTEITAQNRGTGHLSTDAGIEGKTVAEMQQPRGYTGIYSAWDQQPDVWDFGGGGDYPMLKADLNGDGLATAAEFGEQHR